MSRDRTDGPTRTQLTEMVRFFAKTCVEVERGLRPPEQLTRYMEPDAALAWSRDGTVGRFGGGPVRDGDVGPAHLSRVADGAVHATVTTRTTSDRWGAVTLHLKAERGRWMLTELRRVLASRHYLTGRDHGNDLELPLGWRIDRASEERRLVEGALQATRFRIDELPAGPDRHDAQRMERSWRRVAAQLDHELADLRSRLELRETVHQIRRK